MNVREADLVKVGKAYATGERAWMCSVSQLAIAEASIAHAMIPDLLVLRAVLEYAQNAPPHGASDGSISIPTYAALRKLEQISCEYSRALVRALACIGKDHDR